MFAAFNALAAAIWLYLPAFAANAAPVLLAKVPFFARMRVPLWRTGLGANKTWLGLVGGVLSGVIVGAVQIALTPWAQFVDPLMWMTWSVVIAFGALLGDAVKSYCKRRMGIAPGGAWPVIDGIDYVIGALLCGLPLFVPVWQIALALLIAGPVLSLLANVLSYAAGLKKVWY